ncbi:MAG: hypothetical protein ACSHYA_13965 [Opitutaceae bacterium]
MISSPKIRALKLLVLTIVTTFTLSLIANGQQTTVTAHTLDELRAYGLSLSDSVVTLSPDGSDPHPVTGEVVAGHFWMTGDHITDRKNNSIFMELGGRGNTFILKGTTLNVDTREFAGYGRSRSHGSSVHLLIISGENNTVKDFTLIGHDLELDTDPGSQRHADWGTQYVKVSGDNNLVDGATVVVRGSLPDAYGVSDAFGKGRSEGRQPYLSHRKAAGLVVTGANNATVNNLNLEVKAFGHGFFTGNDVTNTTLKNSKITGELFPSRNILNHRLFKEHGRTWWGHGVQDSIMLSGSEGGVRTYGGDNLTVENVVVDGMRTGFATVATRGQVKINNCFAYNTTSGFDVGDNTTITNSGGNIANGPLLMWYTRKAGHSQIELELQGGIPVGVNWSAAYVNGKNVDFKMTSDLSSSELPEESYIRLGQKFFENWRDADFRTATPEDNNPTPLVGSSFVNDTAQMLVIGEQAYGNVGRSKSPVISNGKENHYDGVTLVRAGSHLKLSHVKGLGNNGTQCGAEFDSGGNVIYKGTATEQTVDDNSTIIEVGGQLELGAEIRIKDEKLTLSGHGTDGQGALVVESGDAEFGSSLLNDQSVIYVDGNASIGVKEAVGRLKIGGVEGTGDLSKRGSGVLTFEEAINLAGNLIIETGTAALANQSVVNGLILKKYTTLVLGVANTTDFGAVSANRVRLGGQLSVALLPEAIDTIAKDTKATFEIITSKSTIEGAFTNIKDGARITTAGRKGSFLVSLSETAVTLSDFVPSSEE